MSIIHDYSNSYLLHSLIDIQPPFNFGTQFYKNDLQSIISFGAFSHFLS